MKIHQIYSYIGCLLILALSGIATSCSDDEIAKGIYNVKEGVPVKVSLKFGVQKSEVISRSAATESQEQSINRYYVIAFNRFGEVSGHKYTILDETNETGTGTITDFEMTSGSAQQLFVIGNPVALGESMIGKLNAVQTLDDFKKISATLQDTGTQSVERTTFLMIGQLLNTEGGTDITLNEEGVFVNVPSPATVTLKRVDARISFTVKAENPDYTNMVFTPRYCNIYNVSRNTYLVSQDNDYAEDNEEAEGNYADVTSYLFDGGDNTDGYTIEFYLLENRLDYKQRITQNVKTSQYNDAESLYALREKREKTNLNPDGSKPGQTYVPGDFVFANDQSTYVQLRGTLTYTDESQGQVIADVSYKIHLGNTGNDNTSDWANNEDLVNNYETKRNTWYKYNVTITGVETLRVEVDVEEGEEDENRPGAEGDVIVAGESMVNLDSHYGRSKFTLTRGAIQAGLSWAFSTPFQRGIKVFSRAYYTQDGTENESDPIESQTNLENREELKTDLNLNDYKWVQFVINKECGVETSNYAKYPGYEAYDGGSGNTLKAPAFGGEGIKPEDTEHYSNIVKMYDVNQLLNHLYLEANDANSKLFVNPNGKESTSVDDEDATVTITAFIDEYIYKYNPTEVYYEEPDAAEQGDPDLKLWKRTVNGDNRMLHICKEGAKYSPDGNTSWAESVITFSQCPVYTFYDPNSDVTTAWGTEAIMETGPLPIIPNNESQYKSNLPPTGENGENITSPDNGRANTLKILEDRNLNWSDILYFNENQVEDNNGYRNLQNEYNSIWFACLGRNRDLNGNDIVDENEIRWYLASIDQLTDLWIGEQAVPNARLYTYRDRATANDVPKEHVASSTYHTNSPTSPWIIWAEEGASRGNAGAGDYEHGSDYEGGNNYYHYRCIRNLGLSLAEIDEKVNDYVQKEETGTSYEREVYINYYNTTTYYTEKWIDVSRLEQNTLRAYEPNRLPKHNEQSDYNRPYTQFAMLISQQVNNGYSQDAVYPQTGMGNWSTYYNGEANGTPCPSGYRIPNQRELMLMYTTYPEYFDASQYKQYDWDFMCKTAFSYDGGSVYGTGTRIGFVYDVGRDDPNIDGNLKLLDSGDTYQVKVRCVRDITNEEAARRTDFPATE